MAAWQFSNQHWLRVIVSNIHSVDIKLIIRVGSIQLWGFLHYWLYTNGKRLVRLQIIGPYPSLHHASVQWRIFLVDIGIFILFCMFLLFVLLCTFFLNKLCVVKFNRYINSYFLHNVLWFYISGIHYYYTLYHVLHYQTGK